MLLNSDNRVILYDGAMGTMLQKRGLKPGDMPDLLNVTSPDAVEEVHRLYIEAGSNIICTNTFGANAFALRDVEYKPEDIISRAVSIAKKAITTCNSQGSTLVALDIGPIGDLLEPYGDLEVDRAIEMFSEQAIAGVNAGADCVAIETMGDLNEMEAAIKAVSKNTNLPILATMTFDVNGRTFMGNTIESFAELAMELNVFALGMNCSLEPKVMFPVAQKLADVTKKNVPLIFKLNAGLPDGESGNYSVGPVEFAEQLLPYTDLGMRIVGGCCGTSPEYINELKKRFK